MKVILLGPPGSGKGTQGQMICEAFNLVHISTGDILRQAVKDKTDLGLKAKSFMETGTLVSDDLINQMVVERLKQADCKERFLLDGYPRTIEQAKFLDSEAVKINTVILINVPDGDIVKRIIGRRVHPESGRIYHLEFSPPKVMGKDDITGDDLVHRSDDHEETVLSRLSAYHNQTSPLINFYIEQKILTAFDGNKSPDSVFKEIKVLLEKIN